MQTAIVWFRQDLRLHDNPALLAALQDARRVIPLYIFEPHEHGEWQPGAASNWWLHHSLAALDDSLRQRGSRLVIRRGDSAKVIEELIAESNAEGLFWNRLYEPARIARDKQLKHRFRQQGLTVESFNASLLFEPWQVLKNDGSPYKVFTPYWNRLQQLGLPSDADKAPDSLPPVSKKLHSVPLAELQLTPTLPWANGFHLHWQPGEAAAIQQLERFAETALADYDQARDIPGVQGTSRLSPHLHFGEISPRQVVAAIHNYSQRHTLPGLVQNAESHLRELAWREFAHYLLYYFPHTHSQPFNPRFEHFPWDDDKPVLLHAWQRGLTGIPIVDAGMRELWQTGWMHNRVRMIVASLLTKNLLQHWLHGAHWFWDTLVDADLASNSLGWQWVAGCGADAAPYFRVFNPVRQGQKFDPKGRYVRRWVPELAGLPDKHLHAPWLAPTAVLQQARLTLGRDYPLPVVDLKASRAEALARYAGLKSLQNA